MMAKNASIDIKLSFEYLNDIDDLLVVHTQIGKLKFETVVTREVALRYILDLKINSTEPRIRKMEN